MGRSRVRIATLVGVVAGEHVGPGDAGGVGKGGGLTDTRGTTCVGSGGGERGAELENHNKMQAQAERIQ